MHVQRDGTDGGASVEEPTDLRMHPDAVAAFLEQQGWGCLTLADGGSAYSIPISFGYDGDGTVYFHVHTDDDGEKMRYLDATATATFLVADVQPPEWTSVMLRGAVTRVPDDETPEAYAAFADNAWFPMCPWVPEKDPSELAFYKLDADDVTGRTSML
ncbi:pyridoxamine 5'-phosphate oxidase family protein [Halorussus caseinilyticus]|uniref:Pyridoxamine 5'-phosphate oxidase family protein n=1 Tax=Halorussus caseinilyticus TaxID=3034025 RepID=A0ABD5WLK8_9EURY|nr:pyridoxamine 5'-phosphate oxidase family protein [Halorussus sp. DT72]